MEELVRLDLKITKDRYRDRCARHPGGQHYRGRSECRVVLARHRRAVRGRHHDGGLIRDGTGQGDLEHRRYRARVTLGHHGVADGEHRSPHGAQREAIEVAVVVAADTEPGGDQAHAHPAGSHGRDAQVSNLGPGQRARDLAGVVGVEDDAVGRVAVLDDDPGGVAR